MQHCPTCNTANTDDRTQCISCGRPLANTAAEIGQIDYLLGEIARWRQRNLLPESVHESLRSEYQGKRRDLLGMESEVAPAPPPAPVTPQKPPPPAPERPPAQPSPEAAVDHAWELVLAHDYAGAVAACSQAIMAVPDNAKAFSIRATAYERLDNPQAALADAIRAWQIDPSNPVYVKHARRLHEAAQTSLGTRVAAKPAVTPAPLPDEPKPVSAPAPAPAAKPEPQPNAEPDVRSDADVRWISWLNAFLEEHNIQRGWVIVGILLVSGFAGLVQQTWGTIGQYLLYLALLVFTGACYGGGSRLMRAGAGWRASGLSLVTVGLLLLPVDVLALRDTLGLNDTTLCFLASAISFAVYAVTAVRLRIEWLTYLPGVACLSCLYYGLRLLDVPPEAYGLFSMPLAFGALMAGWRLRQGEGSPFSRPLLRMAHITAGLTLAGVLINWQAFFTVWVYHAVGVAAIGAALYLASGYLFDDLPSVYLSAGPIIGFALLLTHGLDPAAGWPEFRIVVVLVSGALLGASLAGERAPEKGQISTGYRICSMIAASLVVAVVAGEALLNVGRFIPPEPSSALVGTIIVCALSCCLYTAMAMLFDQPRLLYVTGLLSAYVVYLVMGEVHIDYRWWSVGLTLWALVMWLTARGLTLLSPARAADTAHGTGARTDAGSEFAAPLYICAYLVAAVSAAIMAGVRLHVGVERDAILSGVITFSLQTLLFAAVARAEREPNWLHAAIPAGVVALLLAMSLTDLPGVQSVLQARLPVWALFLAQENYGWRFSIVTAVLLAVGCTVVRCAGRGEAGVDDGAAWALPCDQWMVGSGVVGLTRLAWLYGFPEVRQSVVAGLYAYAGIAATASVLFRNADFDMMGMPLSSALTYTAGALFATASLSLCDYLMLGTTMTAFLLACLAVVYAAASLTLRATGRAERWAVPLFHMAHLIAATAAAWSFLYHWADTGFQLAAAPTVPVSRLTLLTTAIASLISAVSAVVHRRPMFLYSFASYSLATYSIALHIMPRVVLLGEANYGLLFIPYVLIVVTAALVMQRVGDATPGSTAADFARPLWAAVAVVAVVSIAWQAFYAADGLRMSVLVALLTYTILSAVVSLFARLPELLYVSMLTFAWSVAHVCIWRHLQAPVIGVAEICVAWFYVGIACGTGLQRLPEWAAKFDEGAMILAVLSAIVVTVGVDASTAWAGATVAILGTLLLCGEAIRQREIALVHLSALLLGVIYCRLGTTGTPTDLWAMTPAFAAAALYLGVGLWMRRRSPAWLSVAVLWWGGCLADINSTVPVLAAAAAIFVVAALVYTVTAQQRGDSAFAYPAAATFIPAHYLALAACHASDPVTVWTGLALSVALALTGNVHEVLRPGFRNIACILSVLVMAQAPDVGESFDRTIVAVYAVLYFAAAWGWRSPFHVHAAVLLSVLATWLHCNSEYLAGSQTALCYAALGMIWAMIGVALTLAEAWSDLPRVVAFYGVALAGLSAIGGFGGALTEPGVGRFGVYALIVDAVTFALLWYQTREEGLLHVGYLSLVCAYFLPLLRLGVTVPDAYALPIGGYLLALGYIGQRTGRYGNPQQLYGAGLLIVLASSFMSAMPAEATLHQVLLMTFCVAAVAVGMSQRMRTFVAQGAAFLIVFVTSRSCGVLPDVRVYWAYYAITLAVLIATALLVFNAKREEILDTMRQVRREWQTFQ